MAVSPRWYTQQEIDDSIGCPKVVSEPPKRDTKLDRRRHFRIDMRLKSSDLVMVHQNFGTSRAGSPRRIEGSYSDHQRRAVSRTAHSLSNASARRGLALTAACRSVEHIHPHFCEGPAKREHAEHSERGYVAQDVRAPLGSPDGLRLNGHAHSSPSFPSYSGATNPRLGGDTEV